MDYESEQAMELEALEAIFADQLEEFEGNTPEGWSKHGKTWAITILPSAEVEADPDEADEPELQMQLVWAHSPSYPDEPPSIRLRSIKGLGDNDLQEATQELQRHIEESLGMPMIYNLVTAAQEWLAARVAAGPAGAGLDPDAEEKKRREEEEAARAAARAHGTPVTVEAFMAWRAKHDAERKQAASEAPSGVKGDAREGRVTGKQWFMQQLAAGKGESSGSEVGDDEEDVDYSHRDAADLEDDEDEDEDFDFDAEDSDEDDDMLDEYLATKGS